ncbi:MAG TPA: response regulator [Candidatus Acidoferrum sp.]|nr:response regulator [Candidatus Acidoferrum sp.]
MRVLIVGDLQSDEKLITDQLRRDGYQVESSRVDTEAAYRAALNPQIDVILSDSEMPALNAERALEILNESRLEIPLIIVSATIGEEAAADLMRQGAADYVSKESPGRLGMVISRAMEEAELRRGREKAVGDLRVAEASFRALFESDVIGIIRASPTGQILEGNSYFLSMIGRAPADLPLDWAAMTPEQFQSKDRQALRELKRRGRTAPWEKEFLDGAGRAIPVLVGSAKLGDDSLVCFVVDLTQAKAAQAKLELAKSELETSIEKLKETQEAVIAEERLHALGQMAAGIAHDFNNCLSPIVGLSELILSRPHLIDDHAKVLKYVSTIHQAGRDAALVVSRLRDYYREAATGDEIEVVDLKQVVEDTIELTRSRWSGQAMASNTKYKIVTKLDGAIVAGSPSELREMLVNLIFNALDAMPSGGKLSLGVELDLTRPGIVKLEVTDTGVGMTPEVRKRCMEPFFTTKGAAGTGLGLATSYRIVKRHHGEIEFETEPGHGTRVTVSLPIISAGQVQAHKDGTLLEAMHILLIDDEEIVRSTIAEYLFADGHKVDLADGPGAGLRKIHAGPYDLIITDRAMPEMSGDQLAIQARRIAPRVPILMLTGFGEFMNAADERPEAVDVVVSKPVTIDALRAAMATAMRGKRELTPTS